MRLYVVPLLLALSSGAFAQLLPGEQLVQGAMQTLNTSPTMFLNLTGTEVFGTVNNAINYTGYFNLSVTNERILAQVEFVGYNNGKPFIRIVGDGVTLWRYDYLNNRYSATVYGTYSGLQPADYSNTFFRYLSASSEGYVTYMTNLLRQVYGASGASYQSWMPGIKPFLDVPGNLNYTIGQPPRRTIIFGVGTCLLYTSDAADDLLCVDLGGRRI